MNTDMTKEKKMEVVNKMPIYAKQYNTAIGFGWVKDCGDKSENHYTIMDRQGNVIFDYTKIHPFSFSGEDKKFQGRDDIKVFELDGIKFSIFICYDLRFFGNISDSLKESTRDFSACQLASKGVSIGNVCFAQGQSKIRCIS